MNSTLEGSLANFSSLAYCIAIVFAALGCRRIRVAGGDKAFGVAALLAFAYLALYGFTYISEWLLLIAGFLSSSPRLWTTVYPLLITGYQIAGFLLLLFTAVFATGCIRSARRVPLKST
jgi:hypothetical protein